MTARAAQDGGQAASPDPEELAKAIDGLKRDMEQMVGHTEWIDRAVALTREFGEREHKNLARMLKEAVEHIGNMDDETTAQAARIERLEAALKPFADSAEMWRTPTDGIIQPCILVQHLGDASAALEEK